MSDHCIISTELPLFVKHGRYFSIAEGCAFLSSSNQHQWTKNHKCVFTTNYGQGGREGDIVIGHDVWIGREVRIMQPVNIGNGAIIGAYSVITKDVPPFAVVVGNPQVIKRYRFTKRQIAKLNKIAWWNWEQEIVQERMADMLDIDIFLKKYG